MAELAKRYLREYVAVRRKPPTAKGDRQVIGTHVVPVPGTLPMAAIRRSQVAELRYRSRNTPAAANEAVGVLSRMLDRAEAWGMVPVGSNPRGQVRKYRARRLERFLTEGEFRRLGETLGTLEAGGPVPMHATAALRPSMLTGAPRRDRRPAVGGCAP